ncbi:MAG: hypothetical protein KGL75_14550, partial [Acidobacteriota bacterium]|nr:hypothetical protein [Acidobacteriota bacterium]
MVVIGRRTFEIEVKLGHLELYGKKPVVLLSSRAVEFSPAKGVAIRQMSGTAATVSAPFVIRLSLPARDRTRP